MTPFASPGTFPGDVQHVLPNGLRHSDCTPLRSLDNVTELPMHSRLVEEAHEFLIPLHLGFDIREATPTDAPLQCLRCACQAIDQDRGNKVRQRLPELLET
jgi:hypothetical protein